MILPSTTFRESHNIVLKSPLALYADESPIVNTYNQEEEINMKSYLNQFDRTITKRKTSGHKKVPPISDNTANIRSINNQSTNV